MHCHVLEISGIKEVIYFVSAIINGNFSSNSKQKQSRTFSLFGFHMKRYQLSYLCNLNFVGYI